MTNQELLDIAINHLVCDAISKTTTNEFFKPEEWERVLPNEVIKHVYDQVQDSLQRVVKRHLKQIENKKR